MILLTSLTMQSPSTKFFFLGLIALSSTSVRADVECTLQAFDISIKDDSIISSATQELSDGKVSGALEMKKCMDQPITLSCEISNDGKPVNANENKSKYPYSDLLEAGICDEFDPPVEKNEDCSVNEGNQEFKLCDICKALENFPEGAGLAECVIKTSESNVIAEIRVEYTNKSK